MSSFIASQPDSVDADRSGGSRSQRIPGNVKTAPGGFELRANVARTTDPEAYPLPTSTPKGGAMRIPVSSDARHLDVPGDPAAVAAAIAHLDYNPACEGRYHTARVSAEFFVDLHGCFQKLTCGACLVHDRTIFMLGESLRCRRCRQLFCVFEHAFTKVVPL
ncbi:hypothetical protein [Nocardia farcinica]|uniref:hypothetical protein n=1 Tax=Nocardia farcinica TaxID=37329 RepID=UPI002454C475|nr:hypothetical protein [Nocardia farcinica]